MRRFTLAGELGARSGAGSCALRPPTLFAMPIRWFSRRRGTREPSVLIDDPRVAGWETVSTFDELRTALAWRDRLQEMGVGAACAADHPPDRFGRGDIYLVVPPGQWSRANEIIENLD